jgi:phosphatidate cytidylyltransferase
MKRVVTAVLLFPVITYTVLWAPDWALLGVTSLVAVLCYHEFAGIAAAYETGKLGPLGYAGLGMVLAPEKAAWLVTGTVLLALCLALRADDLRKGVARAAFTVLGVVYVFGCWQFAPLLAARHRYWLMFALILNWVGDIGAYYVGRAIGRHKLAPIVSPGKSWEGSAASLAVSLLFGYFFLGWASPEVSAVTRLGLAAGGNVAGQFGDLCESALKRGARVKDSGRLLPGHGGMLDRVDSTLFTLPLIYWLLTAHW